MSHYLIVVHSVIMLSAVILSVVETHFIYHSAVCFKLVSLLHPSLIFEIKALTLVEPIKNYPSLG